ncbi:hypothetical protein ScalyP_jg5779 [Parmales sp. scaly parma]|nr:hypothetical protein ScalyP_jg5779 [Parmales sp. scaly parma]
MSQTDDDPEATYYNRVIRLFQMMDMSMIPVTETEIDESIRILASPATMSKYAPPELARVKKVFNSAVHPDTKEKIFLPLRLSMMLPTNALLTLGMVAAAGAGSIPALVAAQWANQTYNVLHYYAYRNASNAQTNDFLIKTYVAACTASVGCAVGMEKLARMSTGSRGKIIRLVGPVASVAAANIANISLMRQNEFLEGIDVMDEDNNIIGKSKKAGAIGVATCITGRVLSTLVPLSCTPILQSRAMATKFMKKNPKLEIPCFLLIISCMIGSTIPFALGVFKQHTTWPVSYLEHNFSGLHRQNGKGLVMTANWNRGL